MVHRRIWCRYACSDQHEKLDWYIVHICQLTKQWISWYFAWNWRIAFDQLHILSRKGRKQRWPPILKCAILFRLLASFDVLRNTRQWHQEQVLWLWCMSRGQCLLLTAHCSVWVWETVHNVMRQDIENEWHGTEILRKKLYHMCVSWSLSNVYTRIFVDLNQAKLWYSYSNWLIYEGQKRTETSMGIAKSKLKCFSHCSIQLIIAAYLKCFLFFF